jgi:ABC-type sugar transport system ATPase subunit
MSLEVKGLELVKEDYHLLVEDLKASRGEYLVILGPSGSGKTLLLRAIAGLEKPLKGEIYLDGEAIHVKPPEKRHMAFVPQDYALWPHMSALENIIYPLVVKGVPREKAEEIAVDLAVKLGIERILERKPATLSSGEQQRVALARALAVKPRVLLLDEPLANLDPKARRAGRELLSSIHGETGTTIIHVTHNIVEALTMATKIAYLEKGRITCTCTPSDFPENPQAKPYLDEIRELEEVLR